MNALDLIMLGRQLTKIGEEVLRGPGGHGTGRSRHGRVRHGRVRHGRVG